MKWLIVLVFLASTSFAANEDSDPNVQVRAQKLGWDLTLVERTLNIGLGLNDVKIRDFQAWSASNVGRAGTSLNLEFTSPQGIRYRAHCVAFRNGDRYGLNFSPGFFGSLLDEKHLTSFHGCELKNLMTKKYYDILDVLKPVTPVLDLLGTKSFPKSQDFGVPLL